MNMKLVAVTVGTIATKVFKIGATQTAVQSLQNTNRRDINEMINEGNYKPNLKVVTKEDLKEKFAKADNGLTRAEELKEGAKEIGNGILKMGKVGVQTQAIYSLNEMNRDEMKQLDGEMKRGYKYNVSPRLQDIKKIKVGRGI